MSDNENTEKEAPASKQEKEKETDKKEQGSDKKEQCSDKKEQCSDKKEQGPDKKEQGPDKKEQGPDKKEQGPDKKEQGSDKKEQGSAKKSKPESASKSSEPKMCNWCGEAWEESISGPFRPAPDVKALLQFFHTVEGLAGRGMSMITRAYPEINNPATMKRIQKLKVHFPSPEEVAQEAAAAAEQKMNKISKPLQPPQAKQQHPPPLLDKPKPNKAEWKLSTPNFGNRGRESRMENRFSPMRRESNVRSDPWRPRDRFRSPERSIWVGHNDSFMNEMPPNRRRGPSPGPSMGSRMDSGRNFGGYSSSTTADKGNYSSFGNSYSMQQSFPKDNYMGNSEMMDRNMGPPSMQQQQSSQWSSGPTPLMDSKPLSLERSMGNAPYNSSTNQSANNSDESMQRMLLSVMKGSGGNQQSMHDQELMQRMLQSLMGGMPSQVDGSMLGRQGGMM